MNESHRKIVLRIAAMSMIMAVCSLRGQSPADSSIILEILLEEHAAAQESDDNGYYLNSTEASLPSDFKYFNTPKQISFLKQIPDSFLTEQQLSECQEYISIYGVPEDVYELLSIPNWTIPDIEKLLPYLDFSFRHPPVLPLADMFRQGKHEVLFRYQQSVERKKGFKTAGATGDSRYLGIAPRLYMRYKFHYGTNLSIGLTAEQDPGEPFAHPSQRTGVDYLSGHLFLKDRGVIRRLAVGDYEVNLGEGLFLQHGFGTGKGLSGQVRKRRNPLRPHTSANESVYFRGIAAELCLHPNWNLLVFGSARKLDGNRVPDQADTLTRPPVYSVTSLQTSGLHRTETELEDKNSILMQAYGGSVTWSGDRLRMSVQGVYYDLSVPLRPIPRPDNRFAFRGDRLVNAGLDYRFLYRNISLFGELAFSDNGGWSMVNGGNFRLPGGTRLSAVHRYYGRDFHALYPAGFGETRNSSNEHGIFLGIRLSPFAGVDWYSYVDLYRHDWLRYGIDAPSGGIEIASRLSWRPRWNTTVVLRGRFERHAANTPVPLPIDRLVQTTGSGIGLQLQFSPADGLLIKTRLDYRRYREAGLPPTGGIAVCQDIKYTFHRLPVSIYARIAVFQTDSYDSRVYAYENDVLYSFSVPAYHGQGSRYYLMAKVELHRYVDCWIRWSQTLWTDRSTYGSGLEEVPANTRSEIKCQLRIRF